MLGLFPTSICEDWALKKTDLAEHNMLHCRPQATRPRCQFPHTQSGVRTEFGLGAAFAPRTAGSADFRASIAPRRLFPVLPRPPSGLQRFAPSPLPGS